MVDTALQKLEASANPIRVGMVGAGATGRAIALQLGTPVPGMRLVAIANRTPEHAERAFREAGFQASACASTQRVEAEASIARGVPAVTDDPFVLTACEAIDMILEVTGTVEAAAGVVLDAFDHGKHVVLVNAELDSLLGPILKVKADEAGVVVTHTDGDEPGVAMTLLRYLRTLGLRPSPPATSRAWSTTIAIPTRSGPSPRKTIRTSERSLRLRTPPSFRWKPPFWPMRPDFSVGRRGMYGPACKTSGRWRNLLPADQMLETGLVDYALGAAPHTGAFVIVHEDIAAEESSTRLLQARRRPLLRLLHAVPSASHPDCFDHRPRRHSSRSDRCAAWRSGLRSGHRRQARSESRRASRRNRRLLHLRSDRQSSAARAQHGRPAHRLSRKAACCVAMSRRTPWSRSTMSTRRQRASGDSGGNALARTESPRLADAEAQTRREKSDPAGRPQVGCARARLNRC